MSNAILRLIKEMKESVTVIDILLDQMLKVLTLIFICSIINTLNGVISYGHK